MQDSEGLSRCKESTSLLLSKSRALCTGEDTSCSNVAIRASVRLSILCFKGLLTSNNRRLAEYRGALKLVTADLFSLR